MKTRTIHRILYYCKAYTNTICYSVIVIPSFTFLITLHMSFLRGSNTYISLTTIIMYLSLSVYRSLSSCKLSTSLTPCLELQACPQLSQRPFKSTGALRVFPPPSSLTPPSNNSISVLNKITIPCCVFSTVTIFAPPDP